MADNSVKTGKVKFFNKEKKFGFIVQDHKDEDIFFHVSSCKDSNIKQDDLVSYFEGQGNKGVCAEEVTVL